MLSQTATTANGSAASTPLPATKKGKTRKSRRKLLIVLVVVVVVAAFGADKFVLNKPHRPTKAVPGRLVTLPETTLNLSDGQLLQVALAVQLQKGVGGAKGNIPAWQVAEMENAEITVLSSFSSTTLMSGHGKDKATQALLSAFRSAVGPGPVGPGVMAVYYTDFVMQ
jgi:flagellar basal body-associated protein FliL